MDLYRTHRRVAATCLVLGPLAFTVGDLLRRLVEPAAPKPLQIVEAVGQQPTVWLIAGLLSAATAFLLAPGVVAAMLLVRGRGARTTTVGATMVAVGAIAALGHAAGYFGSYGGYASSDVSGSAVTALESANNPFFVVFIVLFMVGMMVGTVVLSVGLRRAGVVPVWAPVAAVVFVGAGSSSGVLAGVIGVVAALATYLPVARFLAGDFPRRTLTSLDVQAVGSEASPRYLGEADAGGAEVRAPRA